MQRKIILNLLIITTASIFSLGNNESGINSNKEKPEQVEVIPSPPPRKDNPQTPREEQQPKENQRPPQKQDNNSGKEYPSLTTDYKNTSFKISSMAIENGELLDEYKCEKKVNNIENSIPLSWENIPEGTNSIAIIMYHYPNPNNKTSRNSYLLLWGIDPKVQKIDYGMADKSEWYMGQNKDGNSISYTSPCSQGPGVHQYIISIFALGDYPEQLPKESSVNVDFDLFMSAIENVEILGRGDLIFNSTKE